MGISEGERLPEGRLLKRDGDGFGWVSLSDYVAGRKVVIFALPGAYTGTCSTSHLPSFIRTAEAFREKGVDEIVCISVNDPFVLNSWGDGSGATEAGITMLADADASFTRAVGMQFTVPEKGFHDRSGRYAVVLDDGVVTTAMIDKPGVCDLTTGEQLLEAMT
jgi:glutaredoxin/glutathione-dependent peroxiredoxin